MALVVQSHFSVKTSSSWCSDAAEVGPKYDVLIRCGAGGSCVPVIHPPSPHRVVSPVYDVIPDASARGMEMQGTRCRRIMSWHELTLVTHRIVLWRQEYWLACIYPPSPHHEVNTDRVQYTMLWIGHVMNLHSKIWCSGVAKCGIQGKKQMQGA